MFKHSIPYQRKGVYLLITLPLVAAYALIGWYLQTLNPLFLVIYGALFTVTISLQSYNCLYWKCPHIGTLCPGAGGFCVLSSPLALLLFKLGVRGSKGPYTVLCSIATLTLLGIAIFPTYFLYQAGIVYLVVYVALVSLHSAGLLLLTCPTCGAKAACPGGRFSSKLLSPRTR